MFSSATDFVINMLKMNNLIIDAANDKIILQIILKSKSYTNEYLNNSENFDQLSSIIFQFLNKFYLKRQMQFPSQKKKLKILNILKLLGQIESFRGIISSIKFFPVMSPKKSH